MTKPGKKIRTAFTTITILTLLCLLIYLYWTDRGKALREASQKKNQEVESLINRDLDLYYPETPREVVKLYSNILKTLYSGIEDEDIEALALKIRGLYDEELLVSNPEEDYLRNFYSDIATWNKDEKVISFFAISDNTEDETEEIDGEEFSRITASYTIQEKGKLTEKWHFLLRKDDDARWKILGWEIIHD